MMKWNRRIPRPLAELLIAAFVVALIVTVTCKCVAAWWDSRNVRCRSSFSQLGKVMLLYTQAQGDSSPSTPFPADKTRRDGE